MPTKVLIVTLKFPFPMTGACETDCAEGILQFQRLGFDIKVITKIADYQSVQKLKEISGKLGIEIMPVAYKLKGYLVRFLTNPLMLDGAAFEYNDPEIKNILKDKLENWQPDLVWFDCSQMWPLYGMVKKYKIPIFTRSQNFEPFHFLEEHGHTLLNYFRFLPKLISEIMAARSSNLVLAITPKEAKIYRRIGAKEVGVLPLRGLPKCLKAEREIREKDRLNVFFMGSTYKVAHMKGALEFILKEIAPKVPSDRFCFHIFGGKFPEEYKRYLSDNIISRGYVENLEQALDDMDIALVPSFGAAGMKQKVFEPMCRGIPTLTSPEAIAGYPFKNGEQVLLASKRDEFVENLVKLQNLNLRKHLSQESLKICNKLFSQKVLDSICAASMDLTSKTKN